MTEIKGISFAELKERSEITVKMLLDTLREKKENGLISEESFTATIVMIALEENCEFDIVNAAAFALAKQVWEEFKK